MFEATDLPITPEVLTLIAEIDEFRGAWRALGSLAPERLSALRRVATIESIGSSTRIDGSKLSDRDAEPVMRRGGFLMAGDPASSLLRNKRAFSLIIRPAVLLLS